MSINKVIKDKLMTYQILMYIAIFGILLNLIFLGIFIYQKIYTVLLALLITSIYYAIASFIYSKTHKSLKSIMIFGGFVAIAEVTYITSQIGLAANFHLYMLLVSIIFVLGVKAKLVYKLPVVIIPLVIYIVVREQYIVFHPQYTLPDSVYLFFNLTNYGIVVLTYLIIFLFYYYKNDENIRKLEILNKQTQELADSKALFLANMSHEIRTPMNGVVGLTELLLEEPLEDEARKYALGIKESSKALLNIINQVLDYSKYDAGKMTLITDTFELKPFLNAILIVQKTKSKLNDIDFIFEMDPAIDSKIIGDDSKLRQVLLNLLDNAFKYTEKGSVTFKISIKQLTDDTITLSFYIKDTGLGIKTEDQNKLFQSFMQAEASKTNMIKGTGLGLAISKQIVDLMQGRIILQSFYGTGTQFTIDIPFQRVENTTPVGTLHVHETKAGTELTQFKGKVLIVDDNKMNAMVASKMVEKFGLETKVLYSGEDAIQLLKTTHDFNLILLDHIMPSMSGIETLKHIKKIPGVKHIPVVAFTATAFKDEIEEFLQVGFNNVLSKPVTIDQLSLLLHTYLH